MRFTIVPQLAVDDVVSQVIPRLVFTLLQGIEDGGNLTLAAKSAEVSYRKAWNLINYWSSQFNAPLVESTRGRGARLAPLGEKLLSVKRYADAQGEICLEEVISHIQSEMDAVLRPPVGGNEAISVSASDCVCLDILKNLYQGETSVVFSLGLFGSQTSLSRSSGNPLALESISDLTKDHVKVVNLQSGSGTRVLFDLLIQEAGFVASSFQGYKDVEQTHAAVCARIANGQADVALGTKGAAAQFDLGFVPLVNENYYFGFLKKNLDLVAIQDLVNLLGSQVWARAIDLMPGMTAEGAGMVIEQFNE